MFDIGPGEFIALAIIALLVFGPERLPSMAAQAGRALREARTMISGARADIKRELGPDLEDIGISDLNPRNFVRKNLLSDEDLELDDGAEPARRPPRPARQVEPGEPPPYDAEAT